MRKLIISEWVSLDGVFDADPIYFDKWWLPFDSPGRQKYIRDTISMKVCEQEYSQPPLQSPPI